MPVIVFDLDGVLIADIEDAFHHTLGLLRSNSTLEACYRESVVIGLSTMPKSASKLIKNINAQEFVPQMISLMKELQEKGHGIAVMTANKTMDINTIGERLSQQGINIRIIERVHMKDKARPINGELPIVVEDNPVCALIVARRGCKVMLVETSYNRYLGRLFSRINKNITFITEGSDLRSPIIKEVSKCKTAPRARALAIG